MKITRRKFRVEIPSVAMGDIAFNLLVFFVILAKGQDDGHLQWTPAKASNLESSENTKVSVLIDKDSKLYLNGHQIGIAQLAGRIETELGGAPQGQRTVLVKVHKDTIAQRFEPVIEAISEAGGDLIHIVEEQQE